MRLILLTAIFFSSLFAQTKPKSFVPIGSSARLYTGDVTVKHGMKFTFEFLHCPLSSELLNIKKFEYVITGESAPTRIINIYARRNSQKKCSVKSQKVKQSFAIQPDITRNTQYFLTTDSDINLSDSSIF